MNINITVNYKKILTDTLTPVQAYLNLRDKFAHALLLESSDYSQKQNSLSYICFEPIASFVVTAEQIAIQTPLQRTTLETSTSDVSVCLHDFIALFQTVSQPLPFTSQAVFGYTSYNAIPLHHPITFSKLQVDEPLMHYQYFKYVLIFNHFNNELYIVENLLEDEHSTINEIEQYLHQYQNRKFNFQTTSNTESNVTDATFLENILQAQRHCYIGDVFQVVLSRKFKQGFVGDEFNVYRALRSINPSPYLFYFDYGSFKLMGSSPEAQITISDDIATICPIAGTYLRTGDADLDHKAAEALKLDPKENAEHVMLVDLARNDLSINSDEVQVTKNKAIEMYSHVIHLVSNVQARLKDDSQPIKIMLDTFPAGTLSGAPKHRAMQIIDQLETEPRSFYGGTIGYIGLDGSVNHAIFIRSIVSKNQTLNFQAGCGIVTKSVPENELQEVYNKTKVINAAIALATTI